MKEEGQAIKMIKFVCAKDYDEMSRKAANVISAQMVMKADSVLGLATGSTPIGTYGYLAERCAQGDLDFSKITSVNLDEYRGLPHENDQSYYYFMNDNLFSHVDIKKENTDIPNGEAEDALKECEDYEKRIASTDGIDIQILGIGQNGHIGFNEPDDALIASTHLTGLTQNTIEANSRFFNSIDDVPKSALTMGIATIMKAKKIILLASGKNKNEAIKARLDDKLTPSVPATMLKLHNDVTIICDKDAYEG